MRLKIKFQKEKFRVPFSYQSILQGFIYNTFGKTTLGEFYHNQGFESGNKKFKLFVFSNIDGNYTVENNQMVFDNFFSMQIASMDEKFIMNFYNFLLQNNIVVINNQIVNVDSIDIINDVHFYNTKEISFRTISPITTYRTENNYFHYYSIEDDEFRDIVKQNLIRKYSSYYKKDLEYIFNIKKIVFSKPRIVKFKNTTYKAYLCEFVAEVNYDTFHVIMNTGLSSKGSCGFGMVEVKNEKTIYLYKSGTLSRKDSSLALEKNNDTFYIPIEQIDNIICFSEINLNKRVLALLNANNVTISFFNFYGDYIGRFTPKKYEDGKILLNQVNCYQDNSIRLYISKQIMFSSFKNMLSLIKYYDKKGFYLSDKIGQINYLIDTNFDIINSIEELLLLEAKIKQIYYSTFDSILKKESYSFEKRTVNPPQNEVNALMSYGYSILYSHYLSVLDRSSLNPQIPFIHSLSKSSDALQYDLADILKPVIIDRLIIRLIRKKQIKNEYFDYSNNRCYLNKLGVTFFVEELDKQLKTTILINGKPYSYKSLISREIHSLSNYIKGKSNKYKPYIMSW